MSILDKIIKGGLYLVAFLVPIFFLPATISPVGLNKQLILGFLGLGCLDLWLIKVFLEGKLRLNLSKTSILALVFIGFLFELFVPAVTAFAGAVLFLLLGFISPTEALASFSNSAPITIGAMFILSGALIRTGTLEFVTSKVLKLSDHHPRLAILLIFIGAFFASAIMNNTPVVLVLIPVVSEIANHLEISKKRFLMPLSFIAILGGSLTLIGTSTNLLVDGVARKHGMAPFGIFEITHVGAISAVVGAICILVLGIIFLPRAPDNESEDHHIHELYLTELKVPAQSSMIGKAVQEITGLTTRGVAVLYIYRSGMRLKVGEEPFILHEGDHIIVRATDVELLTLKSIKGFQIGVSTRPPRSENLETLELMMTSNHMFIGKGLMHLPLLSRYRMKVLGLARASNPPGPDLASVKVRAGDRLLIEADREVLREISTSFGVVASGPPSARPFRRRKGAIAISVILAVVVFAAFNLMPISALALIGVGIILGMRVIDAEEAWSYLDGNVLILIVAMLIMGNGLENTKAVELIINFVSPYLQQTSSFTLLLGVYLLTSLLTETITNNAVAVIMTPIAIGFGQKLGVDPRALVVVVMFGASASFATPIGYQTNTLVYSAGKYSFFDFLKIGVIMNLVVGLATCGAIYAFIEM